ncbi:hypothetical protein SAMN02745148_00013 [Modicisalibacter ilicicola DSM 19980]|uniref:Uncharacterized protein n=1 Tax=Modicisalibacter ilicicola DSM 19980 TaxID=1121942 RepID=A0A1M4S8P8_9GAMM|nr:hypothetical protein [Halomonas ilicicola]SHE28538.1 hypothetical protein SAMN02745148_00013 [Halomonas ilicicola DSM 19980]
MLNEAIEIRELKTSEDNQSRYEVYDSDTGTSLGVFDTYEDAQYEVDSMKSSNRAIWKDGEDADPGTD